MSSRFPHNSEITIGSQQVSHQKVIEVIGQFLTSERQARIDQVLQGRTYEVVPVLENIYDRGNISAVMRSAEAMGYQAVHIIEMSENFKSANRVTQGADKWLDVTRWKSNASCVKHLKSAGYRVLATHLDGARPLAEVDLTQPIALVLGNEKDGVSQELVELADERVVLPMHGFVQSFNISVAGALCLYHIYLDRVRRLGRQGDLSSEEVEILRAHYFLRSTDNPERYFK